MKFSLIATLPLLALASAAPALVERADNTNLIISDLKTLETDLKTLDTSIKASPVNIGTVQNNEQKVEADIKKATSDANASSVATSAESTSIYNEIKNNVQPLVNTVSNDLVTNKAKFAAVKSAVKTDLNNLSTLTGALGKALVAKATGPAKTNGPALTSAIQKKLTDTAAQFS